MGSEESAPYAPAFLQAGDLFWLQGPLILNRGGNRRNNNTPAVPPLVSNPI